MRNIFDQYQHPENRLTHSLVTTLHYDKRLLRKFIRWVTQSTAPTGKSINIIEQSVPGDMDVIENDNEERGLPDAWIYDDNNETWSLIIESKVRAKPSINQIRRHYNTARRRGFSDITILLICTDTYQYEQLDYVISITWSEIYQWLVSYRNESEWARRTSEYFEIAETKLAAKQYLEGALTTFSGIPFDRDNTYSYPEAKRVLKLTMDELRHRKDLVKELRMDPNSPGRGMITGKGRSDVWDYLGLKMASGKEGFTRYPHLTVAMNRERLIAITTIPNRVHARFRKNLKELGNDGFQDLMSEITKQLMKVLKKERFATPMVNTVQRRYITQSSPPIVDAMMSFDLRTAFNVDKRAKPKIKSQIQWLNTTYDVLANKKSNLQIGVGASFPYEYCTIHKSTEILDYIAETWIACKPLIDTMTRK